MKKNFGVIGLGTFGSNIAITLEKLGQQVIAVDNDESAIGKIAEYTTLTNILDSRDKKALEESGINACDTVIVSLGDNCDASFLTVLNLKEIGIKNIIVKAHTLEEGRILDKIGATRVIYPEMEGAIRLANQLTSSDILEYIEISPDYQVTEIEVPKEFIGKKIEELHIAKKFNILIIAIREKERTLIVPASTEIIKKGCVLVVVGQTKDILTFVKKYNSNGNE
jgi:trk system potassium uptake protein TrkA